MVGYDALRNAYHGPLAIPPVHQLGATHWMLVAAANQIRQKTHKDSAEVGTDEIYWWVFTRETDLEDLRDKTSQALGAADNLKKSADSLGNASPKTYPDLIALMIDFVTKHDAYIQTILTYVEYLHAKHLLSPAMLFSYRIWGSTPQGDRWANLKAEELKNETDDTLQDLGEVVLGLSSGQRLHAITRAEFEIGADKYESAVESGKPVEITEEELLRRTSFLVMDECREYFTKIRESLRNINLDIEKCKRVKNALDDEGFWRRFILAVTNAGKTETELWDFKEVLPLWMAKGPARDAERVSFSEGVAAFANHKGGVLIVGVTDAKKIVGLDEKQMEDRLKSTRSVLDDHLQYSRTLVTFKQVTVSVETSDKLCLVIAVKQAAETVRVKDNADKYSYPVRQETGLARVDPITLVLERKGRVDSDNYDFLQTLQQFIIDNPVPK